MGIFNLFGKAEIKKEYHENGKLKCEGNISQVKNMDMKKDFMKTEVYVMKHSG